MTALIIIAQRPLGSPEGLMQNRGSISTPFSMLSAAHHKSDVLARVPMLVAPQVPKALCHPFPLLSNRPPPPPGGVDISCLYNHIYRQPAHRRHARVPKNDNSCRDGTPRTAARSRAPAKAGFRGDHAAAIDSTKNDQTALESATQVDEYGSISGNKVGIKNDVEKDEADWKLEKAEHESQMITIHDKLEAALRTLEERDVYIQSLQEKMRRVVMEQETARNTQRQAWAERVKILEIRLEEARRSQEEYQASARRAQESVFRPLEQAEGTPDPDNRIEQRLLVLERRFRIWSKRHAEPRALQNMEAEAMRELRTSFHGVVAFDRQGDLGRQLEGEQMRDRAV
jgi:hypothetical protein